MAKIKADTGKWLVNNDLGLWMIDLACPKCLGGVVCCKVDIPKWCGQCGEKLVKEGDKNENSSSDSVNAI